MLINAASGSYNIKGINLIYIIHPAWRNEMKLFLNALTNVIKPEAIKRLILCGTCNLITVSIAAWQQHDCVKEITNILKLLFLNGVHHQSGCGILSARRYAISRYANGVDLKRENSMSMAASWREKWHDEKYNTGNDNPKRPGIHGAGE